MNTIDSRMQVVGLIYTKKFVSLACCKLVARDKVVPCKSPLEDSEPLDMTFSQQQYLEGVHVCTCMLKLTTVYSCSCSWLRGLLSRETAVLHQTGEKKLNV